MKSDSSAFALRFLQVVLSAVLSGLIFVSVPASAQESGSSSEFFEIDALNSGLDEPGRAIDRSTPRAAVEGFKNAGNAMELDRAAHFLNLSDLPEEEQRRRGAELALKLYEVMQRKVWISWSALPDRPDGLDAYASDKDPMAGKPRRSIRLAILEPGKRPVDVTLERVKPSDGSEQWVFSSRTVSKIDSLYATFGPGRMEASLPDWAKEEAVRGIPWWQIVLLPFVLALSALAGWLVHCLAGLLRRPSNAEAWVSTALERIRMPLALVAGAVVANILISSFLSFSGPINAVLSPLLVAFMIFALALGVLRIIDTILDFVSERYVSDIDNEENSESRHLYTNISVARRIVILLALLIGVGILVVQLNLSQTLGVSLLASAGILTLIFGFAAREVLGNILASVQIAFAKPIRIGDAVFYEDRWGYIEEINYTYVLIRIWDERRLVVPVRYFISQPFENWSIRNARLIKTFELTLDHPTDIEKLREAFDGFVREDEDFDGEEDPLTLVTGQNELGIVVRFSSSAKDPTTAFYLNCRLREKVLAYIRDEGIKAYPVERQINQKDAA